MAPLELIASLSPLELIVNIRSVAGEMSLPSISLYSASKSSLHAFTKSIQLKGMNLTCHTWPNVWQDYVQSIEQPPAVQPKWYRELDSDVKHTARGIIRPMEERKGQIVIPPWYHIVFILGSLFLPLAK